MIHITTFSSPSPFFSHQHMNAQNQNEKSIFYTNEILITTMNEGQKHLVKKLLFFFMLFCLGKIIKTFIQIHYRSTCFSTYIHTSTLSY
jgi:hypothetical protein